jgi:transcriptional regulator with XRE-family HTH domain
MAESRSLGDAIRLRRLELGMSQEELAERIGPDVRQSDVSRLERGKILFPRLERLHQIAAALGLSIGALLIEAGWFTDDESASFTAGSNHATGPQTSIVVADDEPISLEAIVALLGDSGHLAASAYDLNSLRETVEVSNPHIVIVDFALPGLDPESLIATLSMRHPAPVLVFMGSGLPDFEIDGPYLENPIDSRQLFALIASVEKRKVPAAPSSNGEKPLAGI